MGEIVTLTAMVLSTSNVGDYDRRMVLLTKERGKISAFAKGARKPNSPFVALCQPFTFGQFAFYEGRNSYNLHHADIHTYFTELREDLERVYYGMYFCEFAESITTENNDDTMILKLLYQSLKALSKESIPLPLVRVIFEIKALAYYGQAMEVFACTSCKTTEGLQYFYPMGYGVLCETCGKVKVGKIKIKDSTRYTLQYILATPLEKLYTFTVKPDILHELCQVAKQYVALCIDKKFKTLDFLESIYAL